jgi:methionyl-tRNA formyltransferase
MKLVFAGTSAFAVPALEALHASDHEVALVLSQPPRPAGRGRRLRASPLHVAAETFDLPVETPDKLDDPDAYRHLVALAPDALIVVAYGRLIPLPWLELPRCGAINLHPSLLPRWRGAAPVERAMLAGDRETGVAVMRMVEALDAGAVYRRESTLIGARETAGELSARLARRGGELLLETLDSLVEGRARAEPQHGDVTYAERLSSAEARLDFTQSALDLARHVRAFNPRPVAWCELDGGRLRVFRADAMSESVDATPGTVVAVCKKGLDIATGEGFLRVTELQRAGRKVQTAEAFANGGDWLNHRLD